MNGLPADRHTNAPTDRPHGISGDDLPILLAAWIDGEIDAAGVAALETRLASDPAARRATIAAMFLDAQLTEEFSAAGLVGMIDTLAPPATGTESPPPPAGSRWTIPGRGLTRFAAAVLVAALLGTASGVIATWKAVSASAGSVGRGVLAEVSRVRLAVSPAASHNEAGQPLARGRTFQRGRVAIASGAVELAVVHGAMIVLEGPAEIELLGPDRAFLHRGVAVIRPPAAGEEFELETSTARLVGRSGGEFAAKVDSTLTTDVQVYLGDVLVTASARPGGDQYPERLPAGEAVRISSRADAAPERLDFSERRFTRRVPDDSTGIGLGAEAVPQASKIAGARHASIIAARAASPVTVDGVLDEWPAKPAFRRTRSDSPSDPQWIEGWMMYDDARLYIAARVGDPLPLRNSIDPELDAALVWQGGGLQLFFSGDRATGWPADANGPGYYTNRKMAASFADKARAANPRLMTMILTHHAPSGADRLFIGKSIADVVPQSVAPGDYAGRFRPTADNRGYTLEYAIPWATLGLADDPPRPGDDLAMAWELHYSEETGKLWRDQIVEIRNPSEPAGIFLFERAATWGRAEFR
jgi:anti-sigma factor RsiW